MRIKQYTKRLRNPWNEKVQFETKCVDVSFELGPDLDLEQLFREIRKVVDDT